MAITPTFAADANGRQRVGKQKVVTGRLTFGGSDTYATGGFAYTPALFGLSTIESIELGSAWTGTTAVNAVWDKTNTKIMLFETAGTVDLPHKEVSNTQAVNSYVLDITVKGR